MTQTAPGVRVHDQIETLALDALVPYARNSRTHSPEQVAQIAASIREFGFTNPVLIDDAGGIIAGHGRVLGARAVGLLAVPCLRLAGLSEAQKRAYVIADNKLALNAGWDEDLLREEMEFLNSQNFDLSLTGFNFIEIEALEAELLEAKDPDAVPDLPKEPKTQTGDVWVMGQHRLVCGDSTSLSTLDRLMQGGGADMCWTDPPYNVAYETKAGKIANDDLSDKEFRQFLVDAFIAAFTAIKPGGAIYVAHADTEGLNFRGAFAQAGFKLSGCLVWRKDSLVLGRSDYQWQHEPILYGWKPGKAHRWFGGRKQTTVVDLAMTDSAFKSRPDGKFEIHLGGSVMVVSGDATVEEFLPTVIHEAKPKRSEGHPTMKPVVLVERMLRNNAKKGDVVLDLFGGSGSTLMAAERLGMCARLSELDRGYCDVIVKRWEDFTGKTATLEMQ